MKMDAVNAYENMIFNGELSSIPHFPKCDSTELATVSECDCLLKHVFLSGWKARGDHEERSTGRFLEK